MDNLIFERVWQDGDLFEIEVTAQLGACPGADQDLLYEGGDFAALGGPWPPSRARRTTATCGENGDKGDAYPPYVSLRFYCKDRAGHIGVEVFMEIDDGGSLDRHHCCFELSAEAGMLNRFGRELRHVTEPVVGMRVELQLRD